MKTFLKIILLLPLLSSCEKILFEKDMQSDNPRDNFEYLWKQCDQKYSFFAIKGIDWNQKYSEYSAKIYDGMSNDSLFTVLGAMLDELRDGHVNLVSDFNVSHYNFDLLGPRNFDWRLVRENYLGDNYYSTGPFVHNFIASGQVGYIRFNSFTGTVTDEQLDFMLNRYSNTKGLIFDLRSNGGGAVTDMHTILSHFIGNSQAIFKNRIKAGPGHDEFTDPVTVMEDPASGTKYLKPVMVLIDRGTFSAASFTSLSVKAISNMTLMGDTTGGGLGLPNGGQLPNGWTYRFSVSSALDLQGNNYENGVPPDIYVVYDVNDFNNGIDTIIEAAIQELI